MPRQTVLAVMVLTFAAALVSGCGGDDDKGGGGGSSLPSIGRIDWVLDGGSAPDAGRDGGDAGSVSMNAAGGFLADDGRPRPTLPGSENLLNAALSDGTVSWAEVELLPGYALVGTTATVTAAAGFGFALPSGSTLDLSAAPSGVTLLEFVATDRPIILRGTIRLTRPALNCISLTVSTDVALQTGIEFTGRVLADAAAGMHSSTFSMNTSNAIAGIICLGTGSMRGGAGTVALDGGNGGGVSAVSNDEIVIRIFSVQALGGNGAFNGGLGGNLTLITDGNFLLPLAHGLHAHGGNGGTGFGGNGGVWMVTVRSNGALAVYSRVEANGGLSVDGMGGGGGGAWLRRQSATLVGTCSGILYATVLGGNSTNANGGTGGMGVWHSETLNLARMIFEADGGTSQNLNGGGGGTAEIHVQLATDVRLDFYGNGANGGDEGGNGGNWAFLDEEGSTETAVWTRVNIYASGNGGNGGMASVGGAIAGSAGQGTLGSNVVMATLFGPINGTDIVVRSSQIGGNGTQGGSGGSLVINQWAGGTMGVELRNVNLSGGNANGNVGSNTSGGSAGHAYLQPDDGAVMNVQLTNLLMSGGNAFDDDNGGAGGQVRGDLNIDSDSAGGNLNLTGAFTCNGGNAPGAGNAGYAGRFFFTESAASTTGANMTVNLNMTGNGGSAPNGDGGIGGNIYLVTEGVLSFAGTYTVNGGAGNSAGEGGTVLMDFAGGITISGTISSTGGGATANGGSMYIGGDNSATVTLTATAQLRTLGAATVGIAGVIELDPTGSGPGNPNLVEAVGSVVEAIDGDGTDVSSSNVTRD